MPALTTFGLCLELGELDFELALGVLALGFPPEPLVGPVPGSFLPLFVVLPGFPAQLIFRLDLTPVLPVGA